MSDCPDEFTQKLWVLGELPEAEQDRVDAHLEDCSRCSKEMVPLRSLSTALQAETPEAGGGGSVCLSEVEVGAWVDGTLGEEEGRRVVAHVATCASCGREAASLIQALRAPSIAAEVTRLHHHPKGQRPWPLRLRSVVGIAGVTAAAAVAGFLFLQPPGQFDDSTPVHRDPFSELGSGLSLRAPSGPVSLPVEFQWSSSGESSRFRVTLFDDEGATVWEAETGNETSFLPDSITLEEGVQYMWMVSSQVQPGRWVSSDLVGFTISGS